MSESSPSLDAIPLPGESRAHAQHDKKKPKLRRLQDTNQTSSIIVTKVVTIKPFNTTDPETKLKANLPHVASPVSNTVTAQPAASSSSTQSSSSKSSSPGHSKSQPLPPSQTIVDELFKDFLAAKKKEEVVGVKKKDPDIANSMEEMSKLLDEEISLINAKQVPLAKPKSHGSKKDRKKGRWDSEVKKSSAKEEGKTSKSEPQQKKKGRWDSESTRDSTDRTGDHIVVGSHGVGTPSVSKDLSSFEDKGHDEDKNGGEAEGHGGDGEGHGGDGEGHGGDGEGHVGDVEGKEDEGGGKKGSMKLGIKLEISAESVTWINSGEVMDQKRKMVLEEGEVLSSSTDENSGDDTDDSDKDELMETGSLSNSDKEGKSKSKKKKKHKHKHKKKKKHKSGKSDRKSKEKSSKEDKESKKSEDGKKREKEEKREKKKEDKKEHKSKSSDKRKHSRSRSKSPKKRRTRSRSRSKEPYRDRFDEWDARSYIGPGSRERERSHDRSRSRSQERSRHGDRDHRHRDHDDRHRDHDDRHRDHMDRHRDHGDKYHDHDDRYRDHGHSDRDRSSDRDRGRDRHVGKSRKEIERDLRVKIDKSKLRKIAIANVLAAVKAGEQGSDVDLATLKAGGKSVEELTDFCKKISEKERDYSDSDSDSDYGRNSDADDVESPFINHPFKLRDPSTLPNIIMNIRNSKQLPVLTPQAKATQSATLRLQFPVSSGSQHRQKETEWVPVEKTTAPPAAATTTTTTTVAAVTPPSTTATTTTAASTSSITSVSTSTTPSSTTTAAQVAAQIATASTVSTAEAAAVAPEDKVFPDPPSLPIDIGAIVSERLSLVRKLTENPYDVQALCSLHKSQEKSSQWAASKFLPGHFTGSTGVQTLSQQELAGPDKKNQAWFKKDQLKRAAPVQGGIGMWLLQKMGWKQGEGLGKNNEGSREPLMLDFKIDRRGLTSEGENSRKAGQAVNRVKDLSGKHPVSALTELCNKRRWGPPNFVTVAESGPDHKKNFLFKVVVNGVEYQPSTASANKKLAKAQAASVCLQEMGLIPRE